jgi:predicted anti-sigma-YlaC factor YlaD
MNTLNCEYVRDVYAEVLHGRADAQTTAAVRAHLTGCVDCRAEAALIESLFAASAKVPAGLHDRVVHAIAAAPRVSRFAPRRMAMAATVAAALIGGTLLVNKIQRPDAAPAAKQESGLGVVTVEAAMVSGTGSLQDLTVEELEQLLGEIES